MNYGTFLSSSVTMPWSEGAEHPGGITEKGITIQLGTNGAVCFDTDLLRYAGAWSEGWLTLYGTPFDGTHRPPERSRPMPAGSWLFGTEESVGWANRTGSFDDPRKEPYGPIPTEWGQFRGLYRSGEKVALSYRIGGSDILDVPEMLQVKGKPFLLRTLRVGPSSIELKTVLADLDIHQTVSNHKGVIRQSLGNLSVVGDLQIVTFAGFETVIAIEDESRAILKIPPHSEPVVLRLGICQKDVPLDRLMLGYYGKDPLVYTKGGPAQYPDLLDTRGVVAPADQSYVVDTLPLPEQNPWNARMRPSGFDFFADGTRAAVSTWSGDVWIVSGIDDQLSSLKWKRYATGLFQPLGLKIVDDQIYVLGRDQITRLHDLNNDGEADFYEAFNNQYTATPNFHEFAMDLNTDRAGNFYFTKGAPLLGTEFFDPVSAHNGCVLKVSKDGKALSVFATGLRAPNGSSIGPNNEVTCSDNEGIWTPVCRLNMVKQGGFYGTVGMHHREQTPIDYDRPLCWLPYAVDNSAGGQVWVTGDKWGPFKNELLHLSYGKSSLFHVLREDVKGQAQGGVTKFPLSFESGIMRGRFNPKDGQLYVCGFKGWQTTAAKDGAFHRVCFTGKTVERVRAMHIKKGGVELSFTTELDKAASTDPQNFNVQQWNYKWSKEYGSDLYSVADPATAVGKRGELKGDRVNIKNIILSEDRKTLFLEIENLKPVMQMMIQGRLQTAAGKDLAVDVYNTINIIPE